MKIRATLRNIFDRNQKIVRSISAISIIVPLSAFWIDYSFMGYFGLSILILLLIVSILLDHHYNKKSRQNLLKKEFNQPIVTEIYGGNIFYDGKNWISILNAILLMYLFIENNTELSDASKVVLFVLPVQIVLLGVVKIFQLSGKAAERLVLMEDSIILIRDFEEKLMFEDIDEICVYEDGIKLIGPSRISVIKIKYKKFDNVEIAGFMEKFNKVKMYWEEKVKHHFHHSDEFVK